MRAARCAPVPVLEHEQPPASLAEVVDAEHGAKYAEGACQTCIVVPYALCNRAGIRPSFDAAKLRAYDSWWAWARQHTAQLFAALRAPRFAKRLRKSQELRARLEVSAPIDFRRDAN